MMKHFQHLVLPVLLIALGCSTPTKVEVRPGTLTLVGKGTKGKISAVIYDQDGKELTGDYAVTWMCLDEDTIKVQQDGTVEALSSGKALVDVEIVGSELPGLPGTSIHGSGTVIVKIPGWIEMSHEQLHLELGPKKSHAWVELRNNRNHTMRGYLPHWKVDNPNIVSVEAVENETKTRISLTLTPRAPGETYISAYYGDLAGDLLVTVSAPEQVVPVEEP